jgi:hypothetical protein
MEHTLTAEAEAGAFLLVDPSGSFQPDDAWVETLNQVLDPDGETGLVCDYPDRPWPEVWAEAVSALRRSGETGEFVLLLCGDGRFTLRLQDRPLSPEETRRQVAVFEEPLAAPGGMVRAVEAMAFFDGRSDPWQAPLAEVAIPAGEYLVRIHQLSPPPSAPTVLGTHGSPRHPAIILELQPRAASPAELPAATPFPRLRFGSGDERFPGALCDATVTRIEDGRAALRLQLTRDVSSGYGRMPLPPGVEVHPGQRLRVRLVEDRRNYWLVEWAGLSR